MKKVIGLLIMLLWGATLFAQVDDEFEKFAKERDAEYSNYTKAQNEIFKKYVEQNDAYIKKLDDEWKAYLEKKFREFELYVKQQPSIGPKPKEIPVAHKKKELVSKPVQQKKIEKVQEKPAVVTTPILQKSEPENFNTANQHINFYGSEVSVDYDISFLKNFPDNISEKIIAEKYGKMSETNYNHLLKQLLATDTKMNLNDWGYYLLIKQISEKIAQDKAGAVFLQWFLLLKSNYKARIAYKNDQLFLLLPTANNIYDVPFFTFDGLKYYLINGKQQNVYTYNKDFPQCTRIFDLNIDRPLNTKLNPKKTKVQFTYIGTPYEFEVVVNKNTILYYKDFPLSDANVYFDATVSAATKQTLLEGLQPLIKARSEKEATALLLRFVQTAFKYKTDQEQFGYEKFFFADELFSYPYSDCEDRSVLFAYLVKEMLKLEVVGVGYSGHMATAVKFNEEVAGSHLNFNNEKYVICDPTYINAPVGMVMPQYENQPAKIFQLRNTLNQAYTERKIWKKTMDKGAYRASNEGDIITDKAGNIYLTGYFSGNVTLGRFELNSKNNTRDMFVAKYNNEGNVVWAQQFGAEGTESGYGITLAENGDIVVVGSFDNNFYFDYKYLKSKEMPDVLVARILPNGKVKWATQVGLEKIGLKSGFMFSSEFEWDGDHVKNNIYGEEEHFENFGITVAQNGNIMITGAPYDVVGLNIQTASYDAGASFSAPEVLIEENSKLLENNYNPAIAGLFAVIKLLNGSGIALPGSEAQKTLDKYNPAFKKRSPHIYQSIGRIQFIKNSEGIVTIKTDDNGEVSFKTLKVNNNASFKVSAYNSGNSQIDILNGVSIGKSIIWYDLNAVKLFKTGDMVMDYDIDHTKIRMGIEKDVLR